MNNNIASDCDAWHIVTRDINGGIGDKFMYLEYQKANDYADNITLQI